MIKIVEGNLLEADEFLIVHQVNCQGAMNSGVAKQIRQKWPQVFDRYMSLVKRTNSKALLGNIQVVDVGKQMVINLFGQFRYGYDGARYTSYDALYDGFTKIAKAAPTAHIAMPYKIGSDRGGADWEIVYKMIETVFWDHNVTLYKLEEK